MKFKLRLVLEEKCLLVEQCATSQTNRDHNVLSYVLSHMKMCAASEFAYVCWSTRSRGASMCPWVADSQERALGVKDAQRAPCHWAVERQQDWKASWVEPGMCVCEHGNCIFQPSSTRGGRDGVCEARGTLRRARTGPARKLPPSLQGLPPRPCQPGTGRREGWEAGRGGRQGGLGRWWGGWGGKARVQEGQVSSSRRQRWLESPRLPRKSQRGDGGLGSAWFHSL